MQKAEEKEVKELRKGYIIEGWIKGAFYFSSTEGSQKGSGKI